MTLREVVEQALEYEREAWEGDEEVNGGDLVEWFGEWRARAAAALAADAGLP